MNYEYLIPKYIPNDCIDTIHKYRQHKDGIGHIPSIQAISIICSELMDYAQRIMTPSGTGGKVYAVYNFTNFPICMLDSNNGFVIVEPIRYNGSLNLLEYHGKIVIETLYQNQDFALSERAANYLKIRRIGLKGCDAGRVVDLLYNDDASYPELTIEQRATYHSRARFVINDPGTVLSNLGGACYLREMDLVITTLDNPYTVWLHPKSDPLVLKKVRPRLSLTDSMGIEIMINDPDHVYDRAFASIANAAIEIPVTRDPSRPSGVSIWSNIHHPDSKAIRFDLNDSTCPLKIYRSRSEAESGGQPDKLLEKQILEQKQRLAQDKLDQDREEFERQKEIFEHQQRKQKEADQRQEREHQRQQQRDQQNEKYEKVSFWRKMLVEGTKAFAAAVTTAAVLVGWYMKQKATA